MNSTENFIRTTPGLSPDAIQVLCLIVVGGFILLFNVAPPDFVFLAIDSILILTGVLDLQEAIHGFGAVSIITIASLMVVMKGLTNTGALSYFIGNVLGQPKTVREALLRWIVPSGVISCFIYDTPAFMLLLPILQVWIPKINIDPRQIYAPFSFSGLLGGMCTLVGTSTNIIIQGAAQKAFPNIQIPFFGVTPFGIPILLLGWSYIIMFTSYFIPVNKNGIFGDGFILSDNESLLMVCRVGPSSSVIGKTIMNASLRKLGDLFLARITRKSLSILIDHLVEFEKDDVLHFSGSKSHFESMCSELNLVVEDIESSCCYIVGAQILSRTKVHFARSLNGVKIKDAGFSLVGAKFIGISPSPHEEINKNIDSGTRLCSGDICWFTSNKYGIQSIRNIPGLGLLSDSQSLKMKTKSVNRNLVEIGLSSNSSMIGQTIRESQFRTKYGAAIVAIRRNHTTIRVGGENKLYFGDVIIIDAPNNFSTLFEQDHNFVFIGDVSKSTPPQFGKFYMALISIIIIFCVYISFGAHVPMIPLAIFASGFMIVTGVMTSGQARAAVNWDVLVVVAGAIGLSVAVDKSGLSSNIANVFGHFAVYTNTGTTGIISAIYVSTIIMTLIVGNNAAALIMFSIAAQSSKQYNIDPHSVIYLMMLAASANFTFPYSYETNILASQLAPYTFLEFARFGFLLQIALIPISISLIVFKDHWYVGFGISLIIFASTIAIVIYQRNNKIK